MKVITLSLRPTSPFHVGQGRGLENVEPFPRADTLYSALCWAYKSLYGTTKLEELLRAFQQAPPFMLSSPLPFLGNTFFFPKVPLYLPGLPLHAIKKLKSVRFFSEGVLELCGANKVADLRSSLENPKCLAAGLWFTEKELDAVATSGALTAIAKDVSVPRTALDRRRYQTELYYADRVIYPTNGAFWLAIRFPQPNRPWETASIACLRMLGDQGLGGERSNGNGLFEITQIQAPRLLQEPATGNAWMNLAPYWPAADEIPLLDLPRANYRIIERRGWISYGQGRFKSVRMFEEGSIFPAALGKDIVGGIADITPEGPGAGHPVYRFGYAFPVAVPFANLLDTRAGGDAPA